ncbi:glycosyltransferase [Streptomyces sp. bgisy034]|uniref:glycosyltransferase family 2 protein n=1 Tax=Streptomyces sp. bgisy034 TaxID=3413774 RepID=UPI003EBDE7FD
MDPHAPHTAAVARVGVVVIGHDDAAHVTAAVRSALAQGPVVGEVVAVDDCSTDDSAERLTRLAASEPRVRVVRRRVNSGGCGSPRNTGLDRVTSPYVMFLDSGDVLPPGAADALLRAATDAGAEVAGGLCVLREVPEEGRSAPEEFEEPAKGRSAPEEFEEPAKERSAPEEFEEPAKGRSAPEEFEEPEEGRSAPEEFEEPAKERSAPEEFEEPAKGRSAPEGCDGPEAGRRARGREVPWEAALYATRAVYESPAQRPRLVRDALCVNKLYRTDFLRDHGIRFPEGRFRYGDFVFGARVLAAGPRIALVPNRVYVRHVRGCADRLPDSPDRAGIADWRARTEASRAAYEILLAAGRKELAREARAKFLDHELRMYACELESHDVHHRRAWWTLTRAYLAEYDASDWEHRPSAPGCLVGRVVLASPEPRDLPRIRALASRPARLLPPYAHTPDGTPAWSADLPRITLDPLLTRPVRFLPLTVDAELRPRARTALLRLRLHELYGRVAQAGPEAVEVEWRCRATGRAVGPRTTVGLTAQAGGRRSAGVFWTAEVTLRWAAFAFRRMPAGGVRAWDLRLRVRFRGGAYRDVTAQVRAGAELPRRCAVVGARYAVVLMEPYSTHSGALALRVAPASRGVMSVVRDGLRRLLHCHSRPQAH